MVLDLEPFENFPKTKMNFAHIPQVRERAAMVKRRYVDKVRGERADIITDFRDRFRNQMQMNSTPPKTQQRLVEMLDRYVPPPKRREGQRRPGALLPPLSSISKGQGGRGG